VFAREGRVRGQVDYDARCHGLRAMTIDAARLIEAALEPRPPSQSAGGPRSTRLGPSYVKLGQFSLRHPRPDVVGVTIRA